MPMEKVWIDLERTFNHETSLISNVEQLWGELLNVWENTITANWVEETLIEKLPNALKNVVKWNGKCEKCFYIKWNHDFTQRIDD